MSSILSKNFPELTVAEFVQLLQEVYALPQSKSKSKSKTKKEKAEGPKKEASAGVTAWNAFVSEVLEELKSSGWTHPETGKPVTRKDAMKEASKRKAEGNADYAAASAARRAKRDEQLAKKTEAPSEAPPEEKPVKAAKKVSSPEDLEKKAKGKAAKKTASVPPPVVAAPPPADDDEEWIRKTLDPKGKKIKILWNPSNNHAYYCEADGSQGEWAGLYNPKTDKIDDSVEEPQE